jgi:hypothetical protein
VSRQAGKTKNQATSMFISRTSADVDAAAAAAEFFFSQTMTTTMYND